MAGQMANGIMVHGRVTQQRAGGVGVGDLDRTVQQTNGVHHKMHGMRDGCCCRRMLQQVNRAAV